ncbi:MAG: cob(I)yrinic acid a,c-diamide adenosyltransferase [Bacteriovoracia bacterium]
MKIYTKVGDQGNTALFGGAKVRKDHLRIRTYGGIDELNSQLGLVLAEGGLPGDSMDQLRRVQGELFQLGAELATPAGGRIVLRLLQENEITRLESEIDAMEATLPPLKNFILPGGTRPAALLQVARAVCRRAERDLATLTDAEPQRGEVLRYVNRLSDYLFVMSRYVNHRANGEETPWVAPQ